MLSLLGSVLGFGTSFLPKVMDYFQDKEDKKHELLLMDKQIQQQKFALAFSKLDKRLQEIIQKRWLDEPKSTLSDLSKDFGVSAERVRQLEQVALKKLKQDV